jgi:formylglycine-generating enzyme required for sulfatase activity
VGGRYTLPTEAQWEYACRAGTQTAYGFGRDASRLSEYAWFEDNANNANAKYAHEVGLKKANPWGLHDVHGNVREWCRDLYKKTLQGGVDPERTISDFVFGGRVFRGGCWEFDAVFCRSASRVPVEPSDRNFSIGFRVVRSSEQ